MNVSAPALHAIEHLFGLTLDGVEGYRHAAAAVDDPAARALLAGSAARREEVATSLRGLLVELGRAPGTHGSLTASIHRRWVDALAAASGRPVDAVLRECERGESETLVAFRKVFMFDLPRTVADLLHLQLRRIRAAGQEVRRFRLARAGAMQTSARQLLTHEHALIEQLYRAVLGAYRLGDWGAVRDEWNRFETELLAHMEMEEQRIMPAFGEHDPKEAAKLLAEHDDLRRRLAELGVGIELHLVSHDAVADFIGRLRAHSVREELLLYPWIDDELTIAKGRGSAGQTLGAA